MKQTLALVALLLLGVVAFLIVRDRGRRPPTSEQGRVVVGPDGQFTVLPARNASWTVTVNKTNNLTSPASPNSNSTKASQ